MSLKRIGIDSLNVWWNSSVKPSGAGSFFLGRVFIANRFVEIFCFSSNQFMQFICF